VSIYDKIPEDLKSKKRWMVFRKEPRFKDGKPVLKRSGKEKINKAPRAASNPVVPADCTNPANYCSFEEACAAVKDVKNELDGIGYVLGEGISGTDFDDCFDRGLPDPWVKERVESLDTYTEYSISGDGLPSLHRWPFLRAIKTPDAELYCDSRFFCVTGDTFGALKPIRQLTEQELSAHGAAIIARKRPAHVSTIATPCNASDRLGNLFNGRWKEEGFQSQSEADAFLCSSLYRKFKDVKLVDQFFRASGLMRSKWDEKRGELTYGQMTLRLVSEAKEKICLESARRAFESFEEMPDEPIKFLIDGFLPGDIGTALTALPGHYKTFLALSICKALMSGNALFGCWKVLHETPVLYLVPESGRTSFRHRLKLMQMTSFGDGFLCRTFSSGPSLSLDSPEVKAMSKGRLVVLDTTIRFVEGDENSASDNRALAGKLTDLLSGGAAGALLLAHSPKSFRKEEVMTLENALRGTGDIGAMLGAVYAMKILGSLDSGVIHVECVKPRDFEPPKPFQLTARPFIDQEGDLRMTKKPGEAGYLNQQDAQADKKVRALQMLQDGKSRRDICATLGLSSKTLTQWKKESLSFDSGLKETQR